jgi:hypothetical protein
MAHVFCGDTSRVDAEVLAAVKTLPNSYWVLAEFDLSRNIDWFIIRASQQSEPSLLILTELKRAGQALEGDINGAWSMWSPDLGRWVVYEGNEQSMNPYWQAVDTGNALKEWLWNNQTRYMERGPYGNENEESFKIWPDLLILSPPTVHHRLPFRPSNGYGRWFYDIEQWMRHIESWRPKDSNIDLRANEIQRLTEILSLTRIWPEDPAEIESDLFEPEDEDASALLGRIVALERRVAGLERALNGAQRPASRPASHTAPTSPSLESVGQRWNIDLQRTMVDAIRSAAAQGKARVFPTIIEEMNLRLGFKLSDREYLGYGSATMLFNQAVVEGLIQYGPHQGPSPTVYLRDEPAPMYMRN